MYKVQEQQNGDWCIWLYGCYKTLMDDWLTMSIGSETRGMGLQEHKVSYAWIEVVRVVVNWSNVWVQE